MRASRISKYCRSAYEILRYDGFFSLFLRTLKRCLSPLAEVGMVTFNKRDLTKPLRELRSEVALSVTLATAPDVEQVIALKIKSRLFSQTCG